MSAHGPGLHASFSAAGSDRLDLRLGTAGHDATIYFLSRDLALQPNPESFIAAALLPCMQSGLALSVDSPVSAQLLGSLPAIMDIFHDWRSDLRPVEIGGAVPLERSRRQPGRVGVFFSGGVDTFYTLLRHQDEITDLVFIHGFDVPLAERAVYQRTSRMVHGVADRLGKQVVEVETDLRSYLTGLGLRWGLYAHGPTLASVGHLLYPEFRKLYIATSMFYGRIVPWSSHPLLDPLWGTEGLEFVHDGLEARRPEKVRLLAEHDWVLQSLRVCSRSPQNALNCGLCEKCIRTMLSLQAVGALGRCPTFEAGLDPRRVARMRMKRDGTLNYAQMNLDALQAAGGQQQFVRALEKAMRRSRQTMQMRALMLRRAPRLLALLRCFRTGATS